MRRLFILLAMVAAIAAAVGVASPSTGHAACSWSGVTPLKSGGQAWGKGSWSCTTSGTATVSTCLYRSATGTYLNCLVAANQPHSPGVSYTSWGAARTCGAAYTLVSRVQVNGGGYNGGGGSISC